MSVDRLTIGLPALPTSPYDERTNGLVREQRRVLAHLLSGRSCFVNAVAGTGKSLLARTYCDMRLTGSPGPVRFWLMGPAFEPSGVPEYATFQIGEHAALLRAFEASRAADPEAGHVLVVDEATLAGAELEGRFAEFEQVALFGDLNQELVEPAYLSSWDTGDERIPTLSLGPAMRGLNEARFDATNFLFYMSSSEEIPVSSQPFVDHVRVAPCGPDPQDVGVSAYERATRNVVMNPQVRCSVLLSGRGGGDVTRDLLYLSPFKRPLFKVLDPFSIQGFETDIAILSSADVDRAIPSPWDAYVYMRMILGRSRARLEVLVPEGADGPFTRHVSLVARYNYGFAPPEALGFGGLSRALATRGLRCRASREGLVVYRPPDPDVPSDKGRDVTLIVLTEAWSSNRDARRLIARTRGIPRVYRHADQLVDGHFDPEEPWFAKLVENHRATPGRPA